MKAIIGVEGGRPPIVLVGRWKVYVSAFGFSAYAAIRRWS